MRKINSTIDYITKDYEGFRDLMIQSIPKYAPEWTDTSQSDMGVVLIELLSQGLDILAYYQDKTFQENFLATAKTRRSIINLSKMLGYTLRPQIPAKYFIKFNKSEDYKDTLIKIPKGTKIGTDPLLSGQIIFETDEDTYIEEGELFKLISVTHGETIQNDLVGVGDNSNSQKYKLSYPDVLTDTIEVKTQLRTELGGGSNYQYWTKVDDFLSSDATHRHYTVTTDEFNNSYINFGNGVTGMSVPNNYNILVSYRVGGGVIGNVGAKTINTFVDSEINGITSFYNEDTAYQQGENLEDIEQARLLAPNHYRTLDRAITRQDFEDIVVATGKVAKCKVVESFNIDREVYIYVAPKDFGEVDKELETLLLDTLNEVKLVHDKPVIKSPKYHDFDIELEAEISPNHLNSEVKGMIESILLFKFNVDNCDFGQTVYTTDIYRHLLKEVEPLLSLKIITPESNFTVDSDTIPRIRNVSVTVTGGVNLDG